MICENVLCIYNKKEKCRVLLDYKLFSYTRSDSYGIEFQNSDKKLTKRIVESYRDLEKKSIEVNTLSEIHTKKRLLNEALTAQTV